MYAFRAACRQFVRFRRRRSSLARISFARCVPTHAEAFHSKYVDEKYDFLILFSNARYIETVETAEQRNRGAQVK